MKKDKQEKYGGSVMRFVDSNLVHICYNVKEAYISLLGNYNENQFKLYINDTGLLCCMYEFETKRSILDNTIKDDTKGGIYVIIIGEYLVKKGYKLYYYKPDNQHEIEFIIEKRSRNYSYRSLSW